jgi:NitT/TauT family transport system ATP-binding protein
MKPRRAGANRIFECATSVLLDEPFGALNQFTREELWSILQQLWMAHRPTILLVTHDFREAVYLATRVCIMRPRPGRIIEQTVVPFRRPRTLQMTYEPELIEAMQRARMQISTCFTALQFFSGN